MSCHGTPAGITDGRRGCTTMMAVVAEVVSTNGLLESRNDDNTLRASCLKRQPPEPNIASPPQSYILSSSFLSDISPFFPHPILLDVPTRTRRESSS